MGASLRWSNCVGGPGSAAYLENYIKKVKKKKTCTNSLPNSRFQSVQGSNTIFKIECIKIHTLRHKSAYLQRSPRNCPGYGKVSNKTLWKNRCSINSWGKRLTKRQNKVGNNTGLLFEKFHSLIHCLDQKWWQDTTTTEKKIFSFFLLVLTQTTTRTSKREVKFTFTKTNEAKLRKECEVILSKIFESPTSSGEYSP